MGDLKMCFFFLTLKVPKMNIPGGCCLQHHEDIECFKLHGAELFPCPVTSGY